MAKNSRSWGILGSPSESKIEEYKNMPVGSFQNMVKRLSKGKKNVVLREFDVYVAKRKVDITRGAIKVEAFDSQQALEAAKLRLEEVTWDTEPYVTNKEELVYQSYDPLKYKVS